MLKLPLLRNDVVLVAPGPAPWGGDGVWLGRRHLAVWWRGQGPWPEGSFSASSSEEDWFEVDYVRPTLATRLVGRRRRPSALLLRGVCTEFALPFRLRVPVQPCPEAAAELRFDVGSVVATLQAEPLYEAARRVIRAQGGRQARGVFLTVAPGPHGPLARFQTKDGSVEVLPLAGELHAGGPVDVPAALPRWLWWAGYRDDVYRLTRPPVGGWAAWWGHPGLGLAARAWVDDKGTVVQRRPRRAAGPPSPGPPGTPLPPSGRGASG